MFHVQCSGCGKWAVISSGDVHEAVDAAGCSCCPQDHHHGNAANEPGAQPCRPVTITIMAASPVEAS